MPKRTVWEGYPNLAETEQFISGKYALVSGKILAPIIDWDNMREEDNEVEFREEERKIAVNPYHISYRIAEKFDKIEGEIFKLEKISCLLQFRLILLNVFVSLGDNFKQKRQKNLRSSLGAMTP